MQTILVIDDDENLRDTIGVMLEQEGFRAVLAGDGRSGFRKGVTIKPDLVLVDLRLPGMSGTEICKQLRAAPGEDPDHRVERGWATKWTKCCCSRSAPTIMW